MTFRIHVKDRKQNQMVDAKRGTHPGTERPRNPGDNHSTVPERLHDRRGITAAATGEPGWDGQRPKTQSGTRVAGPLPTSVPGRVARFPFRPRQVPGSRVRTRRDTPLRTHAGPRPGHRAGVAVRPSAALRIREGLGYASRVPGSEGKRKKEKGEPGDAPEPHPDCWTEEIQIR